MTTVFASFGNTEYFFENGYKSSLEMPAFLNKIGLNGYEYSCEEGIHISDDGCETLKSEAEKNGISLSVYSGKLFNSLEDCVKLAEKIGAKRVVVPLGNCAIVSRKEVYLRTLEKMKKASFISPEINICPETMGLIHDLGTFEEVLKLSKENENFIPALNFPNLFARNLGKNFDSDTIEKMFLKIGKALGKERMRKVHIYLSNVHFTNQGYKKYADLSEDTDCNFDYKPILTAVSKLKLTPFIVCRSLYNCYNDAIKLKNYLKENI